MANYGGWQIMEDSKLWKMANYGDLKCGWQIMEDNFIEANFIDGRFYRWQLNFVRRNDGS